jgi:hypothetical protein
MLPLGVAEWRKIFEQGKSLQMTTSRREAPKAVQDCHACLLWLLPQLDKFPRNRRFTLGERIESGLLSVLELLIDASYQQRNRQTLDAANRKLAVVRHCWRLSFDLKVIAIKQYQYGGELMLNLGKQIGGWRKTSAPATEQ